MRKASIVMLILVLSSALPCFADGIAVGFEYEKTEYRGEIGIAITKAVVSIDYPPAEGEWPELLIPEEIDSQPVIGLDGRLFEYSEIVPEKIIVPEGIRFIKGDALLGFSDELILPSTVEYIESGALPGGYDTYFEFSSPNEYYDIYDGSFSQKTIMS